MTTTLDRHLRRAPSLLVVLNPNAGRVRRQMASPAARIASEQTPRLHLTGSLEQLDALFTEVPVDGEQTLCFYGGDGSIARGLSAMINRLGEDAALPTILPVAAGTINVMSEYLGLSEAPAQTLARFGEAGRLERRLLPSIKIAVDGHAPIYGFMFGWGVGYRVLESYYGRRPHPTLVDASVTMAQTFAQSLHPRATELPLFSRRDLELVIDGEALGASQPPLHSLIVGVLERSTMGLRPLPPAPVHPRRFHLSGNGMHPTQVFRHAMPLLFARGDQRELEGRYPIVARDNVGELRMTMPEGYTIDGEMIVVEGARACTISAGPAIPFWAAPRT
nr:diacylglycerol kinase family protein [Pseudenhygromyxa sp. WMMC2535]